MDRPQRTAERAWQPPDGYEEASTSGKTCLRLYNSCTDRKEPFVPAAGRNAKNITWYSCGPTVYDCAHMGHARNYVSFDILRRVLADYFGYAITFVMNITDVEDKIVLRARRNHLLEQYVRRTTSVSQVRRDAEAALAKHMGQQEDKVAALQRQMEAEPAALELAEDKRRRKAREVKEVAEKLRQEEHILARIHRQKQELAAVGPSAETAPSLEEGVQMIVMVAGDALADEQDRLHKASVTDESIFRRHSERFEAEFWEDMDRLGVLRPTKKTNVTAYMPGIVDYTRQIMENGFAYASPSGSVYFDTHAFEEGGHKYGKLAPWAMGCASLAADGDSAFDSEEKRSAADFALWKAAKPGEPSWPSPWSRGRPGWHIECSAMASAELGPVIDIHTGGEDLRFPHHDNEIAQAEAYYHGQAKGSRQWVNYFLHSGHLSIEGLKMSKSLKNFITIRRALEDFSPRQLRLMFALQPWERQMTYNETTVEEMRSKERTFKHFFQNVDALLRRQDGHAKMEGDEQALEEARAETEAAVHEALLDNINTQAALEALLDLVKAANKYTKKREADAANAGPGVHSGILQHTALYVTHILHVMGISTAAEGQIGLGDCELTASTQQLLDALLSFRDAVRALAKSENLGHVTAVCHALQPPECENATVEAVLNSLADFRNAVRAQAKAARSRAVLAECDRVRDEDMVRLGVRMVDRPDGSSSWAPEDPHALADELAARRREARLADAARRRKAMELKEKELRRLEAQAALPTGRQAVADKYSGFNEDGYPTRAADGAELDSKAAKKARAAVDKANKARAAYDRLTLDNPDVLAELRHEVDRLAHEVEAAERGEQQNGLTG